MENPYFIDALNLLKFHLNFNYYFYCKDYVIRQGLGRITIMESNSLLNKKSIRN